MLAAAAAVGGASAPGTAHHGAPSADDLLLLEWDFDQTAEAKARHLSAFTRLPVAWRVKHLRLSRWCRGMVEHPGFEGAMISLVVLTAVFLGAETTHPDNAFLEAAQSAIIWAFVAEVLFKVLAEGVAPQRYFDSGWNSFDFFVTSLAVASLLNFRGGFNVSLFRLVRLLQLLRTLSKVERLRIIIESLVRSIHPMK